MADTTERLILELQAKIEKYNANIIKAAKETEKFQKRSEKAFTSVEKRAKKAGDSLFKFSNVAKGVFAAIGTKELIQFADNITLADNQLRNVTGSTEQFNFVLMELNRIANETRQDVNVLTGVFAKFTRAGQEAGFSTRELLDFTESLTKAFKLEGNSVAEVNSVLGQLVQSFRKGNIDGEEFRALAEGSTLALQALAKQLGVNIGDLKELGAQGKIAARDLVEGLAGIAPQINDEFKTLEPTFFEVGTRFGNLFALGFRGGALEETASTLKRKLLETADDLERFFTGKENKTVEQIESFIVKTKAARAESLRLQEATGLDYGGTIRNATNDIKALEVRLKAARMAAEGADAPAVEEAKRKPLVAFGAPEDTIIAQGARRLTIIGEQAEAERQLLQAVDEDKISEAESSAILANQKETDRLNEQFTRTLERLKTNQTQINDLKSLAAELGLEKLTEDEQALLDLAQRAADAKVSITEKQEAKLAKIRDIARKNEFRMNVGAAASIFKSLDSFGKKTEKQKEAQARRSIIIDTAVGIMKTFSQLGYPGGVIPSLALALEGAAALSAVGGGGGGGGLGGGGGEAGGADEGAEAEVPTITDVSITALEGDTAAIGRLELIDTEGASSGDQLMGEWYNQSIRSGRIREKGRI